MMHAIHRSIPRQLASWLVLLCLSLAIHAQDDQDGLNDDVSTIPQRPYGHILDSARWLNLEEQALVQKELERLYLENQIDVYLVTREKLPPQGARTYARKLGENWSRSPVWCVVFHVPGDPAGFHVEAGGVEIDHAKIDKALAEASQRANRENTEKERVMAAWKESSESLRFIHASGKLYTEKVVEAKKDIKTKIALSKKWKKIIAASVAAGGGVFLLLAYGLFRLLRNRSFSYEFPATSWSTRFQGPHSGGSGIVVNYRNKRMH